MGKVREIYLDYMATTPIDARVIKKMQQAMGVETAFANPSSLHPAGMQAKQLVEEARAQVAQAIHAEASSIVWTSGATESNNLAIRGAAHFYARQGKHLVTQRSEHKAVLSVMEGLEKEGFSITYLAPKRNGLIDLQELESVIQPDTTLVSIMWVNNETGVIQPIDEIAKIVKQKGGLLHVDAAQALGKIPIDVRAVPVDLLSLAAHKFYGPKGVGALYIRQKPLVRLAPILWGSGQENGLRPGTIPTHQVVGMGEACALLSEQPAENKRITTLREKLVTGLKQLPGVGFYLEHNAVVPHCLAMYVQDISMAALLARMPDLMIATGSACNSATPEPSAVLLEMGVEPLQADNSCRISLGRYTTEADIEQVIQRFATEIAYLRAVSPNLQESTVLLPQLPYQHAHAMPEKTHQVHWRSRTELVEFCLFARLEKSRVCEFSFLLLGGPVWFATLDAFCSQFAGSEVNTLKSLTQDNLMQTLGMDAAQAHVVHALLASLKRLVEDETSGL